MLINSPTSPQPIGRTTERTKGHPEKRPAEDSPVSWRLEGGGNFHRKGHAQKQPLTYTRKMATSPTRSTIGFDVKAGMDTNATNTDSDVSATSTHEHIEDKAALASDADSARLPKPRNGLTFSSLPAPIMNKILYKLETAFLDESEDREPLARQLIKLPFYCKNDAADPTLRMMALVEKIDLEITSLLKKKLSPTFSEDAFALFEKYDAYVAKYADDLKTTARIMLGGVLAHAKGPRITEQVLLLTRQAETEKNKDVQLYLAGTAFRANNALPLANRYPQLKRLIQIILERDSAEDGKLVAEVPERLLFQPVVHRASLYETTVSLREKISPRERHLVFHTLARNVHALPTPQNEAKWKNLMHDYEAFVHEHGIFEMKPVTALYQQTVNLPAHMHESAVVSIYKLTRKIFAELCPKEREISIKALSAVSEGLPARVRLIFLTLLQNELSRMPHGIRLPLFLKTIEFLPSYQQNVTAAEQLAEILASSTEQKVEFMNLAIQNAARQAQQYGIS